jgi:hypothetical protein
MTDQLNTNEIRAYLMSTDGITEIVRRTMLTLCDEVDGYRETQAQLNYATLAEAWQKEDVKNILEDTND